jgi:hypothetical protein
MEYFRYTRSLAVVAFVQGAYYLLTSLWPLVHLESFMWVTGPKVDTWLVKTVGILIGVIGAVVLSARWHRRISPEVYGLAVGSALGLTGIDVYYVVVGRISGVYLLDALAEVLLVGGWLLAWRAAHQATRRQ